MVTAEGTLYPGGLVGIPTTGDALKGGITYAGVLVSSLIRKKGKSIKDLISSYGGIIEVGPLRKALLEEPIKQKPEALVAKGTLFPGVLLCSGWWERNKQEKDNEMIWPNKIQAWLYRGFEQWAPSLDVSFSLPDEQKPFLYAQLGSGDEADSVLLVVPWEKAKGIRGVIRDRFEHDKGLALEAKVTGTLIHREQLELPETEKRRLKQWGKAFEYCIYLDPENRQHTIDIVTEHESYSGYLWQCLVPKNILSENKKPKLNEVYFVWEHTDFTEPDTVKYNLDSLMRKAKYIESRFGVELVLLHKSSEMVPGDSLYKTQEFYDYIIEGSDITQH